MANSLKILGVIPARYDSKRLPGKVLRNIAGKPMLYWVYRNARQCKLLTDLLVATDSEKVLRFCEQEAIPVVLTGRHPSGTDRLREVMGRFDADIYINIQGDEPMLRPEHLEAIVSPFLAGDFPARDSLTGEALTGEALTGEARVATLKVAVDGPAALDPSNVKVVTDDSGRALYFSRYPIPFDRDGTGVKRYKHIGIYAYTRAALSLFHSLPES